MTHPLLSLVFHVVFGTGVLWMSVAHAADPQAAKAANHAALQQAGGAMSPQPVAVTGTASSFGQRGAAYQVGAWTLAFPEGAHDACIWRDGGQVAVEVIAGSVGWFHLRSQGQECTYYTSHDCSWSESTFYRRPFEGPVEATPVKSSASTILTDPSFEQMSSSIVVTVSEIRVALHDGGMLRFPATSPTFSYTDAEGTQVQLPQ